VSGKSRSMACWSGSGHQDQAVGRRVRSPDGTRRVNRFEDAPLLPGSSMRHVLSQGGKGRKWYHDWFDGIMRSRPAGVYGAHLRRATLEAGVTTGAATWVLLVYFAGCATAQRGVIPGRDAGCQLCDWSEGGIADRETGTGATHRRGGPPSRAFATGSRECRVRALQIKGWRGT